MSLKLFFSLPSYNRRKKFSKRMFFLFWRLFIVCWSFVPATTSVPVSYLFGIVVYHQTLTDAQNAEVHRFCQTCLLLRRLLTSPKNWNELNWAMLLYMSFNQRFIFKLTKVNSFLLDWWFWSKSLSRTTKEVWCEVSWD